MSIQKDDYFPKRYTNDDLYQLSDLIACGADDLEDNLLIYSDSMDSERQKVFEQVKVKLNSAITILNNYLVREKYSKEI